MDRADYFKKKGSAVDAKFTRLHRRSIDQRSVRGKSFMDNRKLEEMKFSPLKENNRSKIAMPPPMAAPPKATKKGAKAKPSTAPGAPASKAPGPAGVPAPKAPGPAGAQGMTRREKLMKWKEEKELKKRQMANIKKPQVFKWSQHVDHKKSDLELIKKEKESTKKPRQTTADAKPPTRVRTVPTKPAAVPAAPTTRKSARLAAREPSARPQPARKAGHGNAPRGKTVVKPAPPVKGRKSKKAAKGSVSSSSLTSSSEEEPKTDSDETPALQVSEDASMNVTCQRGGSMLTETFAPTGFTFSMQLPEIPFTPISPASASQFLFPSAGSKLTPSQRRCSTPYSMNLRTRKSLANQDGACPIPVMDPVNSSATFDLSAHVNATRAIPCLAETSQEGDDFSSQELTGDTVKAADTGSDESAVTPVAMETDEAGVSPQEKNDAESEGAVPKPTEPAVTQPMDSMTSPMETESAEPEKDVPYFKNLVSTETERLLSMCSAWEKIMNGDSLSDEVLGEIRSSIGKAKLLIDQRFKQFLGLIKNCEFGLGEKVTHCSDLAGFWEMIYYQVEDVDTLFKELEKLKTNNWEREETTVAKPKIVKKKKAVAKKATGAGAASRSAARERLLAAKAAMNAKATRQADSEKVVFEGGFFKVESPARKTFKDHCEAGSPFRTSKVNTPASKSRKGTPRVLTTPKLLSSPRFTTTPKSLSHTPVGAPPTTTRATPTVVQLFSPLSEPRRSLRTKLCGEISKLVLSNKKATPSNSQGTPSSKPAETHAVKTEEAEKDVPYFKSLVSTETERLLSMCSAWEKIMKGNDLSDEVLGEVRSSIGKAKLLINQRFKQFLGLIKNCEFGLGEKVTHCSDLAGFWEMIYFQVEDVDTLFKELEKLKTNNWEREETTIPKPKIVKKKKAVAKKATGAGAASRSAARERLLAAKAAMNAKATRQAGSEKVVFEGGFFKVESPARKTFKEHCEAGSPFKAAKLNTPASNNRKSTPRILTTPKLLSSPRFTTTPKSLLSRTPVGAQPTVSQLFSPLSEPRRSLRTKLCGEISKLVLSDKKATPSNGQRTPSSRGAKRRAVDTEGSPSPTKKAFTSKVTNDKENEVDLSLYLQPCASVVDLNQQAEALMVTEPQNQLEQLGVYSPKRNTRARQSSARPKDVFSPSVLTRSQVLQNSTNTVDSVRLCSPVVRKTRKSSLGFGLSMAPSLFTPSSSPEPKPIVPEVNDLICFD